MGSRPTHPELLDYLATYFVENGWSMKKLHRLIVLSNTYRQSSDYQTKAAEADPDNKLLWRYNRHRLEAEAIRDSMLQVSGLLNPQDGRPGRFPAGAARRRQRPLRDSRSRRLELREGSAPEQPPQRLHLRSTQSSVSHASGVRFAEYFRGLAHAARTRLPRAQALDILNNDLILEWSRAFAGRVMSESSRSSEPWEQIDRAYKMSLWARRHGRRTEDSDGVSRPADLDHGEAPCRRRHKAPHADERPSRAWIPRVRRHSWIFARCSLRQTSSCTSIDGVHGAE